MRLRTVALLSLLALTSVARPAAAVPSQPLCVDGNAFGGACLSDSFVTTLLASDESLLTWQNCLDGAGHPVNGCVSYLAAVTGTQQHRLYSLSDVPCSGESVTCHKGYTIRGTGTQSYTVTADELATSESYYQPTAVTTVVRGKTLTTWVKKLVATSATSATTSGSTGYASGAVKDATGKVLGTFSGSFPLTGASAKTTGGGIDCTAEGQAAAQKYTFSMSALSAVLGITMVVLPFSTPILGAAVAVLGVAGAFVSATWIEETTTDICNGLTSGGGSGGGSQPSEPAYQPPAGATCTTYQVCTKTSQVCIVNQDGTESCGEKVCEHYETSQVCTAAP